MATPAWQPGTLYAPGALVVPRSAPVAGPVQIPNGGFDADAAGWQLLATGTSADIQWVPAGGYQSPGCVRYQGATVDAFGSITSTAFPVGAGQTISASAFARMTAGSGISGFRVVFEWLDASNTMISQSFGALVTTTTANGWRQGTVSASAPGGAVNVRLAVYTTAADVSAVTTMLVDNISWNYVSPVTAGLQYRAVQPAIGTSDNVEPAWPGVLGQTVVDNTVTWEAVLMSRVVWEARQILRSGMTEPDWPTVVGATVPDNTISWVTATRQVEQAPDSKVVAITASKVFAADRDIIRYSATVNPLDWTTADDAGYLPSGLNQNGSNDTAVLNIYRSNLVGFSSSTFQNWQVDEDPANMELLDVMEGIGSTWQHAAQPVARDLFYLAALGVRTVGISGGSLNLVNGDAGMPIDPLVRESIKTAVVDESNPLGMYYPSLGQYMLAFPEFPEDDDPLTTTYAYSMSTLGQVGAWSVYEYPWPVEAHAMLGNDLYLRSGDAVFRIDPDRLHDQNAEGEDVEVVGEIQSHYLDMGSPAVTKMLVGVDLVGNGIARISLGFNQTNLAAFTADATVPADTVPGSIIPIPLAAPSFAMRIRYSSMDNPDGWEWLASSFYVNDFRPAM